MDYKIAVQPAVVVGTSCLAVDAGIKRELERLNLGCPWRSSAWDPVLIDLGFLRHVRNCTPALGIFLHCFSWWHSCAAQLVPVTAAILESAS